MSSSAKPIPAPSPADDGPSVSLRTKLANTPMLPAPANVEDLLTRLEVDDDPFDSRQFAAMVSDAFVPDDRPPLPDAPEYEEFSRDEFFAPVALAANANVPQPGPFLALRSHLGLSRAACTGLVAGALLICSTALLAPDVVPTQPESPAMAAPAAAETGTGPLSEPDEQSDADAFLPDAAGTEPLAAADETPASEEPTESPQPELGSEPSPEPQSVPAESAPVPETLMGPGLASSETESADTEPEGVPAQALADAPLAEVPSPPIRPARLTAPFTGVWAVSAQACTLAMQRQEYLLIKINPQRASAGGTTCGFRKVKGEGNLRDIAAVCSNRRRTWRSDVRLSLEQGRLTWKSQRGVETYVRCPGA